MARIARLLCVLAVLSFSNSAFATMIVIIDDDEAVNDDWASVTRILTDGRVDKQRVVGYDDETMTIGTADSDYFRVELRDNDRLMVNTLADIVTTVTLYDDQGVLVSGGTDRAGYINNATAGTYYIGVTGDGAENQYMMTFEIRNHTPEPATMSLLAIGGVVMFLRRRRR